MLARFKTLIAATALLLVLCVIWFIFLFRPQVSKTRLLSQKVKEVSLKLQSLRVSEKKMGALQTSIDTLADEITKTQRMLIAKDDLPAAIDYIRRRGRTFGLTFHQVIPDYQELIPDSDEKSAASGVLRLTVHMKIQGRYKNFGNFIRSLATLPFYVSVSDVTLVYNQDIHPELEIMLDTVVFLLNSSKIKFRA